MTTALLFDLDGTLIDSIELILSSARHAFVGFDGRAPSDDEWRAGIGRPLLTMFRQFTDDEAVVEQLTTRYRTYQMAHHDRLVRAYEGIVPLLAELDALRHPMALVTSKVDWLAERALQHVGLRDAIPVIVGCDSCTRHKPHPEPVERALALLDARADDALFVGDSPHDVEAGRAAGVHTIGVTWGAFTHEELEAAGADVVVSDVPALRAAIFRFAGRA
ncbi:MAG: HAD-superfamily hydrolase subfamily [Gemmatimonadetes bacterium]|jgi:pyrophosphatase PpaX|nr:HAD-superfamily hydrolase subfamily [Gemmatimonadota bacterium]